MVIRLRRSCETIRDQHKRNINTVVILLVSEIDADEDEDKLVRQLVLLH